MAFHLTHNAYGKAKVRLTKVVRSGDRHEIFEFDVAVELEGDFAAAYLEGDNRNVVATDSIKNTVYVLAKENEFDSAEAFAFLLSRHFVATYAHVSKATVEITQPIWTRIAIEGVPHDHAFTHGGPRKRCAKAIAARDEPTTIIGGVRDLPVLKTTASEWRDFHTDRYRTLKDTSDRIIATNVDADWTFHDAMADFATADRTIDAAILRAFATNHSLGVQQTLQHMGEAALVACPFIADISFTLPNMHRIPFNLEPFGLTFENDIYVSTDEPQGLIRGTISRKAVR